MNQQQLSGRSFVGASQLNGAGMNQGMSGMGNGGMQGYGTSGMQGQGNRGSSMYPNDSGQNPNGQGNQRSNGRDAVTIRTVLSVNFELPSRPLRRGSILRWRSVWLICRRSIGAARTRLRSGGGRRSFGALWPLSTIAT